MIFARVTAVAAVSVAILSGCSTDSTAKDAPINVGQVEYNRQTLTTVDESSVLLGLRVAGVSDDALSDFANVTLAYADRESGGNPNAVNVTDSLAGAKDGVASDGESVSASRGYMQIPPSVFAQYHVDKTSPNIYDPTANVAAAWRAIRDRDNVDLETGEGLDEWKKDHLG